MIMSTFLFIKLYVYILLQLFSFCFASLGRGLSLFKNRFKGTPQEQRSYLLCSSQDPHWLCVVPGTRLAHAKYLLTG